MLALFTSSLRLHIIMSCQGYPKRRFPACGLSLRSLAGIMFGLLLALLGGPCRATYDQCWDDESGADRACQPSMLDIIWYQTFKLTVAPENTTCGTPMTTYRRLGDRSGVVETCDAASPTLQHPPNLMVDANSSSWWQSINQIANSNDLRINITLNFNKTFIMAGDIIVTFNSGRPQQMVLEKSRDYGLTWTPLQFYARNCSIFADQLVPGASVTVDDPGAVTCTNRFVEVVTKPPAGQKLRFPLDERFSLFLGPNDVNFATFYAALDNKMLDFLKFTDLRMRLIKPATDGRTSWDSYYYAISDFKTTAWCNCNLHAAYCNYTEKAVICDCQHNTAGPDCETCLPLYNERPWRAGLYLPYDTGTANECQKCECNDHALSCVYNVTYGRGVCQECLHNTRGYHCEMCTLTYYPNMSLPLSDVSRCIECDCDLMGVYNNSLVCAQVNSSTEVIGQCLCRAMIAGRRCDQCEPGYYGLKDGPVPGNCTACGCNLDGTAGQSNTCQQSGGQCPCKDNIVGRECGTCTDGYFSFPVGNPQADCLTCDCDVGGSSERLCNKTNGQCSCRTNITGIRCNQSTAGTFVPALDTLTFEPQSGGCEVVTDRYTSDKPFDGSGFATCSVTSTNVSLSLQSVLGAMAQKDVQWPYIVAVRYTTTNSNLTGALVVQVAGNTQQDLTSMSSRLGRNISSVCPVTVGSSQRVLLTFSPGVSTATISRLDNVTLDVRCQYSLTLEVYFSVATGTSPNGTVPDGTATNGTATNGTAPNGTATNGAVTNGAVTNGTAVNGTATNGTVTNGIAVNGTSSRRKRATLLDYASSVSIDSLLLLPGLSSSDGSIQLQLYNRSENQTTTKESYLSCLLQLSAMTQRQRSLTQSPCRELFFSLGVELNDGAVACACNPEGTEPSLLQSCQPLGGQCQCKPGVSGRNCNSCSPGYYNFTTTGCTPCNCHSGGAKNGACNMTTGQCPCHPNVATMTDVGVSNTTSPSSSTINGTCSVCLTGFYGINSGQGCIQCSCNQHGSTDQQCDEVGQCPCRDSVTGQKCDMCRDGFYGFTSTGCSSCNCSSLGSTSINCNETTGTCACRTNVQGAKCTDCRGGYFNLASYNTDGCQPCFCYGHGDGCSSAEGFVEKMLVVTEPTSSSQMNIFLGDQHISYGLNITLGLSAGYILDIYNETLISILGRGKALLHKARNGTVVGPGQSLLYVVPLLEGTWILDGEGRATIALDVLEILSNVTEVRLITRSQGQDVKVTSVRLESAERVTTMASGHNVTFVEQCSCNTSHHVAGLSCERCAIGHMRPTPALISSFDLCQPCDCHSRGATDPPDCQEQTGLCMNCRNGTTGEHCERCAAFVGGDQCDNCSSGFWGLQADGCRACNCSSPASLDPICDKLTGQCQCASHVSGRTCDQCDENFQGISNTGCVECDVCYSLMRSEIMPLRQLRDSITSNMSMINSRDRTAELGTFSFRLRSAVLGTEQLVNFLTSLEGSATQVTSNMSALNQTLITVQGQMVEVENKSLTLEQGLVAADSLVRLASSHRTTMEAAVRAMYTGMGKLQTSTAALAELARNLKIVESYLQSLANTSTTDQQIISYLASLNQSVARAGQLVNDISQKSQDTSKAHQTSSGQLIALESVMVSVVPLMTKALTVSHSLESRIGDSKATLKQLQDMLGGLTSYTIDYLTMASRTSNMQSLISSYQSQVTAESSLFSPSNVKSLQSVSQLEPFINMSLTLSSTASLLLWRANNAQQRCSVIQSEAGLLLDTATNILATMNNFSVQASAVQQRANASLNQLDSQDKLSQQLIDQSDNLTKALAMLKQNASAARESSQQALQIVQDKQQRLVMLSSQADRLHGKLSSMVDVSEERYRSLNNTQSNILTPGLGSCLGVNASVTELKDKISLAESLTAQAAQKVSNVTQKANQILASLKTITSVDTGSVLGLLDQALTARSNVDVGALRALISQLQISRDIQRSEISRLSASRDTLRDRVQNLQLLLEQIKHI